MRAAGSAVPPRGASASSGCWIEPGTQEAYPVAFDAYRRKREAQDRRPSRFRQMGPDIEHMLWRRLASASDVDIVLAFRPGVSPRIKRLVGQVLRSIRRGRSAREAIRRIARRFGLRPGWARAFIAGGIVLERHPR